MYSLDWRSPACDGRLQAHHAMDLPFVFDNTDVPDTTKGAPGARELAAVVSANLGRLRPQRQPGKPGPAALARLHAGRARDDGVRPRLPCRHRPRPRRPPVVGADRDARACNLITLAASANAGAHRQQLGADKWVPAFAGIALCGYFKVCARSQACSARGRAMRPTSAASALAAVPSTARFAIPCRIAAMRNRL